MPEKIELYIDGQIIEHFISYQIDSDMYTPADAFRLQLANPSIAVKEGMPCILKINGQVELTGIIDKIHSETSKSGRSLSLDGRDLMGILVDSHCEGGFSVANKKISEVSEKLLKPFNNIKKPLCYQENFVGKLKSRKAKTNSMSFLFNGEEVQRISQIRPGMTVFEVLSNLAMSAGMLLWCEPDGSLVAGRPMAKGAPDFYLRLSKRGVGNNVLKADIVKDISKRYSKVIIIGQKQGHNDDGAGLEGAKKINNRPGIEIDPSFPFYKPFVAKINNDSMSLQ
ncbi:MAG: hypothetical protein PHN75_14520, partial [Syntrophales bacterium]|nr:hypothetical protein [Syntrophales bacterium]